MSDVNRALVEELLARVKPEQGQAVNGTYELQFVGDPTRYVLVFDLNGARLSAEQPASGLCRLGLYPEDLRLLLSGSTSLKALLMSGRLRVFEGMAFAMRLEALFA